MPPSHCLNKIVALWAAGSFPDVLDASGRAALVAELGRLQHADGGWSLSDLGPWEGRSDGSPPEKNSDGYATALIVLVREEMRGEGGASPADAPGDASVARGLEWLERNQDKASGAWIGLVAEQEARSFLRAGAFHERRRHRLCRAGAGEGGAVASNMER